MGHDINSNPSFIAGTIDDSTKPDATNNTFFKVNRKS